jgi:DNA-binding NtrC family response regulator
MTGNVFPLKPILLIDDEPSWTHTMALSLRVSAGINNVSICNDSRDALEILSQRKYSLVLLDLTMPYIGGEDLLIQIKESFPEVPVIVVSGMNQIETAIRCVKKGAEDFYVKTDERERVINGILRVLKQVQLREENALLSRSLFEHKHKIDPAFNHILTVCQRMKGIFSYLKAISRSLEPVLVTGESGVGKELIAGALHQLSCPNKPCVAVNVAGLDDVVFSDTLFGHVRGAFTSADSARQGMIEEASGGILFLDEIGDLALASQVKLLRLLQEREYFPLGSDKPRKLNARIVVATNQNLNESESLGTFRRDLLFRLNAHRVDLPPLRQRTEDIPLLLESFIREAAQALGKKVPASPPELVTLLSSYHFPGNIRELRSMVFDAVSVHQKGILSLSRFVDAMGLADKPILNSTMIQSQAIQFPVQLPLLKEVGILLVEEAIRRSNGNQSIAARLLGVTPQALSKRLNKKKFSS